MCSLSLVKDGAAGVLEWSVDIVRVVGRVKAMERGCRAMERGVKRPDQTVQLHWCR